MNNIYEKQVIPGEYVSKRTGLVVTVYACRDWRYSGFSVDYQEHIRDALRSGKRVRPRCGCSSWRFLCEYELCKTTEDAWAEKIEQYDSEPVFVWGAQ